MPIYRHRVTGPGPAGDIWTTGLYSDGSATIDTAHTAWDQFVAAFIGSDMATIWSTEMQATTTITDQLDGDGRHNVAQRRSSITYKGTGTGLQLPQRSAVVVGLRTALPTRSGRGRMYVPAPDSSSLVADGLLSTTVATNIAGWAATALETMTGIVQVVIAHRDPVTKGISSTTPVTSVTVGQVLGTQRRRTNKVPANYQSADLA